LLAQTQSLRHRPHMSDLFQSAGLEASAPRPLADRLRPQFIGDVVGQDHLIGEDGPIGRMLASGRMASTKSTALTARNKMVFCPMLKKAL